MAAAHSLPAKWKLAPVEINDPGTGNAIPVDRSPVVVAFTIAASASETNTLAAPTGPNDEILMTAASVGSGGQRTVTISSGVNQDADTTLVFQTANDWALLKAIPVGSGSYKWRYAAGEGVTGGALEDLVVDSLNVSSTFQLAGTTVTPSAAEINTLDNPTLTTGAGVGVTAGTGTVYKNSARTVGGIIYTNILIDLTGLASSTTDLDIIGVAGGPAHIGQVTAAQNGTILALRMTCLEVPAGGADDVDLYAATEGTGEFDGAVGDLAETALVTSGGAWTANAQKIATADVAADKYLYLTGGEAGTAATYTAGKFLIEMWGY